MIEFYPDSVVKRLKPVAEELQTPRVIQVVRGSQNLTASGMAVSLWNKSGWEAKRVSLHFDAGTAKDYSVAITQGKGVVAGKNNRIWFKVDNYPAKDIYLAEGFYTGTTLATQLQSVLAADATISTVAPITVSWNATTMKFTITAGGGNIQLYVINRGMGGTTRHSSAAGLMGFTADSAAAGSITSDTAVPNLGVSTVVVSATANGSTDITVTDPLALSLDNALALTVSAVATVGHYEVAYSLLDV